MSKKYNEEFESVLQDPELELEIGPDENALENSGLIHPDDLALEAILAEDWDSVPDREIPEMTADEALNEFLYGDEDDVALSEDPTQVISFAPEDILVEEVPVEEVPVEEVPVEEVPVEDVSAEELAIEEIMSSTPDPAAVFVDTEEEEPIDESSDLPEEAEADDTPLPKGRPKWKKGYGLLGIPHIIATAIWLAITLAIGVSLGRVLWVCCADVMAFGKPQVTGYITVTEEDDIESISRKLADANLIRYPGLFQKFAEITEKDERIQEGVYELGSHLDYNAMINGMIYSDLGQNEVEITFPEGYNCAQFFRLLEENEICSVADLEEYAANGELGDYWFLEGVERGDKYCLEGYMAPDTYRFYTDSDPADVLDKFLREFDDRFTDIMKEDLEIMQGRYASLLENQGYDSDYIAEHTLTLHQALTVASIVERETSSDAESYDIASVFYNRVTNPDILTMGSDATVYYAIGDYLREKSELDQSDLESDSPYNTRKAIGIPPGPICNPGVYSLYAALDPNDTNYHYFIFDTVTQEHLFSETYEEHLQKAEELGF